MLRSSNGRRLRAVCTVATASLLLVMILSAGDLALAAQGPGPYFAARFHLQTNRFTFGQTPSWTPAGDVLSNEPDSSGTEQVYSSALDGSRMHCLTCGRLTGPTGFPQARPQGDWILVCSQGAQPGHFGNPCLGGYGSDVYVMRPGGGELTRLTTSSDPAGGARYDKRADGVPYDNYHAYWSPDGRHIVWTRTEARSLAQGGQTWEIMLADFVAPAHGPPHLAHIRVVGPAFGVYETQPWAPDGSGFLFTAFGPRRSPFQATPPGWMHLELYYMRLYGRGASPAHPRVTHLTDGDPAYEEQAVFTSDMRDVIVMTSRARPGTWYQTVITAAQWLQFDAPDPGSAGTPMFLADFSDPKFTSDLYMVDLGTGAVRPLTNFGHVIPEFLWNRNYTKLLWSESVPGSKRRITRVASFDGITRAQRQPPTQSPAPGLFGEPIDMGRVRSSAASGPSASLAVPYALPRSPARLATAMTKMTVPPVVVSYFLLLLKELHALSSQLATAVPAPPL